MARDFSKSTEMDREFDIIEEVKSALDEIDKALKKPETEALQEKVAYLRFLVDDLDDILSGEFEGLRLKRHIVKRTR